MITLKGATKLLGGTNGGHRTTEMNKPMVLFKDVAAGVVAPRYDHIYPIVNTCRLITDRGRNAQALQICLRLYNHTQNDLFDRVWAKIPANEIRRAGVPNYPILFTAESDKIFYGNLDPQEFARPESSAIEFRYTARGNTGGGDFHIYFPVYIYVGVGNLELPTEPHRLYKIVCRAQIVEVPTIAVDDLKD